MKKLLIFLLSGFFYTPFLYAQTIENLDYHYNDQTCSFDSIHFDIVAGNSGTVGYSIHLNLFDDQDSIIAKYLDGGLGGIGGGGSKHHVFFDVAIDDLEGITKSMVYDVTIYIPEFREEVYNSGSSITYECATIVSVAAPTLPDVALIATGKNSYSVQSDNSKAYSINVYDIHGKLMLSKRNGNVSLNHFSKGLYLVEIKLEGQTIQLNKILVK